jgi:hypothetical protein
MAGGIPHPSTRGRLTGPIDLRLWLLGVGRLGHGREVEAETRRGIGGAPVDCSLSGQRVVGVRVAGSESGMSRAIAGG